MKNKSFIYLIKQKLTSNLVIKGTIILAIAGFSTRMIGFYNRIFLSGLIGATQMGIYQLILPLYMVVFAFTNYGNELALTKLVSEYSSRKEYKTVQTFFRICFAMNLLLSLATAIIMYECADWICLHILKAPECASCVRTICFGFPFMAMKGAIHGYFLGLKKSSIHGISDLIEQISKILGIYLIATYISIRNNYDANFALWGVVIGDFIAFIYSMYALFRYKIKHKYEYQCSMSSIHLQKSIFIFLNNAVPFTTNRLAVTVIQGIESIMIPSVLLLYYGNSASSLAHYGTFTGMAFPFIMFPATITNALSTMLLPAVSSAQSTLDKNYLSKLCEKSLHFCLLIGIFSLISFYIYGNDIGLLFFKNKEAGIYLYQLSFLCPLIYLATTMASILNGLGYATHNLIVTILSNLIRIAFVQVAIPRMGMTGYIIGLFVSYLFLTFACLHKIQKHITFRLHFRESIFFPWCSFTILGAFLYYLYQKMLSYINPGGINQLVTLIVTIILFGCISIPPFINTIYRVRQQPR